MASSAFETALARRNHARLFAAQELAAVLQGLPQAPAYPAGEDQQAWRGLALYDEHTWGGFDSITYASSPNARGQWHRKATYAYEAAAAVTRLVQHAQRNLAARLEQPEAVHVLVYNPLPWPRRVPLLLPPAPQVGWDHDQLERNLELASPQGPVMTTVDYGIIDLPACGYGTIPLRHPTEKILSAESWNDPQTPVFTPTVAPGLTPTQGVQQHGWTLENRFYRLVVDPESGGIRSLVDLASGHEWVDTSTPWSLGQYVYEEVRSPRQRSDMQLQFFPPFILDHDRQPELALAQSGPGPVLAHQFFPGVGSGRLSLRLRAPGVNDLWVQMVLYDDLPWIDLIYDLNKIAVTAPESVYVTFPFNLSPSPLAPLSGLGEGQGVRGQTSLPTLGEGQGVRARYEVAGAIVQAEAQQMRYATRDFYAIQNWVDFTDDRRGITVASPDAPMIHIGGFTNHKYLAHLQWEQPLLVGWPVNNHWFTNFRASQSGWLRVRYRLLPHAAPFDSVATTRFGAEAAVEPLLGPVWDRPAGLGRRAVPAPVHLPERASFLGIEPAQVHLIGLKPAADGQGIIVRLQELAGQPAEFRLYFPHSRVESAGMCSLLEEMIDGPQPVTTGNEVRHHIQPHRLQTLRIVLAAG